MFADWMWNADLFARWDRQEVRYKGQAEQGMPWIEQRRVAAGDVHKGGWQQQRKWDFERCIGHCSCNLADAVPHMMDIGVADTGIAANSFGFGDTHVADSAHIELDKHWQQDMSDELLGTFGTACCYKQQWDGC